MAVPTSGPGPTRGSLPLPGTRRSIAIRRLGRGVRIDDPRGALGRSLATQVGAALSRIGRASTAAQFSGEILDQVDGAFSRTGRLLEQAHALAVGARDRGGSDAEATRRDQALLDALLGEIDRIGRDARAGGVPLLDGSQALAVSGADPALEDVRLFFARLPESGGRLDVEVEVLTPARRGGGPVAGRIATLQPAASRVRIVGERGEAELQVAGGTAREEVARSINALSASTGVEADPVSGEVRSTRVGARAFVEIVPLEGGLASISAGRFSGEDPLVTVNRVPAEADGFQVRIRTEETAGSFALAPDTVAGRFRFSVGAGGLTLSLGLGDAAAGRIAVGFEALSTRELGRVSGNGGLADLAANGRHALRADPAGAVRILDVAREQAAVVREGIDTLRGELLAGRAEEFSRLLDQSGPSRARIRSVNVAEEILRGLRNEITGKLTALDVFRSAPNRGAVLRLLG